MLLILNIKNEKGVIVKLIRFPFTIARYDYDETSRLADLVLTDTTTDYKMTFSSENGFKVKDLQYIAETINNNLYNDFVNERIIKYDTPQYQ